MLPDYATIGPWAMVSSISLLVYFSVVTFMMIFNMVRREKASVLVAIFLSTGAAIGIFAFVHIVFMIVHFGKLTPIFTAAVWICQIVVLTKYRSAFFAIFGKDVHQ
jgi:hypothetical protein